MQGTPLFSTSSNGLCGSVCFGVCVWDRLQLVAYWLCKQLVFRLLHPYLPQTHLPRPYLKQKNAGSTNASKETMMPLYALNAEFSYPKQPQSPRAQQPNPKQPPQQHSPNLVEKQRNWHSVEEWAQGG